MSNKYWQDRIARAQNIVTNKKTAQIEKQLASYYSTASRGVINDFERVYNKILLAVGEGREPTPADLYKLDTYWHFQGQLKQRLEELGSKQVALLHKEFELHFFDIYYSIALQGQPAFHTIDHGLVQQMINQIWVADGKTYSQRVWNNMDRLLQTLNEELIHSVITGKKTTDLKNLLQERFNVSYHRANTLVRTELVHIQSLAAQERYKSYGVAQVEVLVDKDHRTCPICEELEGQKFSVFAAPALPAHPNERCCLVPVV